MSLKLEILLKFAKVWHYKCLCAHHILQKIGFKYDGKLLAERIIIFDICLFVCIEARSPLVALTNLKLPNAESITPNSELIDILQGYFGCCRYWVERYST